MNEEQIKSLIDQLKGAGLEEEQIMDVFYETFKKGKMDRKDLETLANALGYELTDDFKSESAPDPIAEGGEDLGDVSKEDLEEAKEIEPGESKEEFEDKIEDIKEDAGDDIEDKKEEVEEEKSEDKEDDSDEDEAEEEIDEDKEWEEANKLFKL